MKNIRLILRRLITAAFLRDYMNEDRLFKCLNASEQLFKRFCIVTVHRAEIAETERMKICIVYKEGMPVRRPETLFFTLIQPLLVRMKVR